jgi:hypothetical protein
LTDGIVAGNLTYGNNEFVNSFINRFIYQLPVRVEDIPLFPMERICSRAKFVQLLL